MRAAPPIATSRLRQGSTLPAVTSRLALVVTACLAVPAARSQPAATDTLPVNASNVFLNAHLLVSPGFTVRGDDSTALGTGGGPRADAGGGLGIMLGYGTGPLTFFGGLDIAVQGALDASGRAEYGVGHLEVGLRYLFLRGPARLVPFVHTTLGLRVLVAEDASLPEGRTDFSLAGSYWGGGVGVMYYLTRTVALDGNAQFAVGKFDQAERLGEMAPVRLDPTLTARARAGLSWYPVRPRIARGNPEN